MDNITAPTLKISGLPDTLNDSCTRQITFTFSEPVTGFDFSDIRQIGGIMVSQEGFFGSGTTYQIQFSALWGRDVSITVPANAAQTMDDNNTGPGEPVSVSKTWTHREPEHWLLEYYKCFSLELYNKYRNDQELFQEYLDTYF